MPVQPRLHVFDDAGAVAEAAAEALAEHAIRAVRRSGRFDVALSGGSTPRRLFRVLAAWIEQDARIERDARIDRDAPTLPWEQAHFFWGDERCVPPDHDDSNFGAAWRELLSRAPVSKQQLHRVRTAAGTPDEVAAEYEAELRRHFAPAADGWPSFHLVLLGMGGDGHTASLFPRTAALRERTRWVVANQAPGLSSHRITFTAPLINHAASVIFLVVGSAKAETLRAVLEGPFRPLDLPSQLIAPASGELHWFVDRAAAGALDVRER